MNQKEFEREALRIAEEYFGKDEVCPGLDVGFANAIRDLIMKDLAENNPPVAFMFYVRFEGKGKGEQFAAIDYFGKSGETIVEKEPLYTRPQPAPEGWQLVPKKPTPEMAVAAKKNYESDEFTGCISQYIAMLAAAPEYKEE